MREPTLKPNVVFPHPDIVQGAMALRRPDLVASFRRSDVRRALKRSRWVSRTHWANNSVSPFLELFDADPDRLAAMVRRWDSSIAVVDTKTNINSVILWRDGDREKQVATPFSLSGWLRFITAGDALVDGVVVPRLNDVKAGLYLGLSYDRSAGFATDREVMAVRMPVLALAAFHLDVSVSQSARLVELFEVYTSMLYSDLSDQSVYEALRRDVVESFTELCVSVGGVLDDVPLWLVFSCITHADRSALVVLVASGVDPVRAVYLWFMGFDFSAITNILSFGIDVDMAISVFEPRYGMTMFDLAAQPIVPFTSVRAFE